MILLLICLNGWLLATTTALENPLYDLENTEQLLKLLEQFISTHGKSYPYAVEKHWLQIFKENIERFNLLNSESDADYVVNQFADPTPDKFVSRHKMLRKPKRSNAKLFSRMNRCSKIITDADITTHDAPHSLDYRDRDAVTSVKKQDSCSSCWTFALTGTVEGQYALKHHQLVSLSAQQVMDCVDNNPHGGHCAGRGDVMFGINYIKKLYGGLVSEADYPYVSHDQDCPVIDPAKIKAKLKGCINFHLNNEDNLKEALHHYGPIAVAVNSVPWGNYRGGVYNATECPFSEDLNHRVLLVGYGTDDGKDYWLIKNSWGKTFGEHGYIRISRGDNACAILNDEATVGIVV